MCGACGDRPGLDDPQSAAGVDPLDVLRDTEEEVKVSTCAGQAARLRRRQAEAVPQGGVRLADDDPAGLTIVTLALAAQHRSDVVPVDVVGVRSDGTLHQGLGQAPGRVDDGVTYSSDRVLSEHHPSDLGSDELLHDHRDRSLGCPLSVAVDLADCVPGVGALLGGEDDRRSAGDAEDGEELAGEGRRRCVLDEG